MKSPHLIPYAFVTLLMVAACSRQGEGERCLTSNGDSDCEPGLVCTAASNLREYDPQKPNDYIADRCCPDPTEPESPDPRCQRRTRTSQMNPPTEGTGGSGGVPGEVAGAAGALDESSNAGAAGLGG
ncbi:MAG: hypothetical protein ACM3ZE_31515 [Myxococcales bacterium]